MCKKTYSEKFNMPTKSELKGVINTVGFLNSILDATRMIFCEALHCRFNNRECGCQLKSIEITSNTFPPTCKMYEVEK